MFFFMKWNDFNECTLELSGKVPCVKEKINKTLQIVRNVGGSIMQKFYHDLQVCSSLKNK